MPEKIPQVAIIDYGLGNLFSILQACRETGMNGLITGDPGDLYSSDGIIIPGVGAFGTAMERLAALRMIDPIKLLAEHGKPIMGICLGFQLMMTGSYEFGYHKGLSLFDGDVHFLDKPVRGEGVLKVPHIGWSPVCSPGKQDDKYAETSESAAMWQHSLLSTITPGELMYFIHSYYVKAVDETAVLSETWYGDIRMCSAMQKGNLFGCQFHPERSGKKGLQVYRNFASLSQTTAA